MKDKIIWTMWFLVFGGLATSMVAVSRPWPEALGLFMAYCLGGLVCFGIKTPKNDVPTLTERVDGSQIYVRG